MKEKFKIHDKKVVTICFVVLFVLGLIGMGISSQYLTSDTARDILEKSFKAEVINYVGHNEGYALINIPAESEEIALQNLRAAYLDMSTKKPNKDLEELDVVVHGKDNKVMLVSNITVDQIISTDWSKNVSYTEFIKMANVQY